LESREQSKNKPVHWIQPVSPLFSTSMSVSCFYSLWNTYLN
jgi:hypothetical protein